MPLKTWKKAPSNRLNIHNQLCIALLETPICVTSIYRISSCKALPRIIHATLIILAILITLCIGNWNVVFSNKTRIWRLHETIIPAGLIWGNTVMNLLGISKLASHVQFCNSFLVTKNLLCNVLIKRDRDLCGLLKMHLLIIYSKNVVTLISIRLWAHTVRKSRNIPGQNRSTIFWYVVLKI